MDTNDMTFQEVFDTEAEAIAFTEGIDITGSANVIWEPPFMEGDQWVVELRCF